MPRANISSIISNNFSRSVFLAPIDPGTLPAADQQSRSAPQFDALEGGQCAIRRHRAQRRGLTAAGCRPSSASGTSRPARRSRASNMSPIPTIRAASRISSRTRSSRASPARRAFSTRASSFVDETGPAEHRRKRLAIMDQDGANVRYLTRGEDLVVTPRFSPSSQDSHLYGLRHRRSEGAAAQYRDRAAPGRRQFPRHGHSRRAFRRTGRRSSCRCRGRRRHQSLCDGYRLARDDAAVEFLVHRHLALVSRRTARRSSSIPTAAATSSFTSCRASGGDAQRISFGDGQLFDAGLVAEGRLHRLHQAAPGAFAIGVMKPDGSGERILTEGFHNEGPTWAPNGLFLMFFRDPGGESGPHIFMIDVFGRAEFQVPTPSYALGPGLGTAAGVISCSLSPFRMRSWREGARGLLRSLVMTIRGASSAPRGSRRPFRRSRSPSAQSPLMSAVRKPLSSTPAMAASSLSASSVRPKE